MKNFCVAVRIFVLFVIMGNCINAMDNDQDNSLKDKTEIGQQPQKKLKDSEKIAFRASGTDSPVKVDKRNSFGLFSKDSNDIKVTFESGEDKRLSEVLSDLYRNNQALKDDIGGVKASITLLIESVKQSSDQNSMKIQELTIAIQKNIAENLRSVSNTSSNSSRENYIGQDLVGRVETLEKSSALLADLVEQNQKITDLQKQNNIVQPTSVQQQTYWPRYLVDTCTAASVSAATLYYFAPLVPLITKYATVVAQYGAASILPYVYIPASVLLLGTIGKDVYESAEQPKYDELSNSWENYFKTKPWLTTNTKPTLYFLKTALVYTACKNRCTHIANMAYKGLLTMAAANIFLSASTIIAGK